MVRDASLGELLGVPLIVVVGRGLADGVIEVRERTSTDRIQVAVDDVVAHVEGIVSTF